MTDDAGGQSALLSQQPAVAFGPCRSAPVTPRTALRPSAAAAATKASRPRATFDPVPHYIIVPGRRSSSNAVHSLSMEALDQGAEIGLTDAELLQVKEDNQRRIKRIVAAVGIALTVISIVLVALSLSLGQKIDELGKYPKHCFYVSLLSPSGCSVLAQAQMRESDTTDKGKSGMVLPNGKTLWSSATDHTRLHPSKVYPMHNAPPGCRQSPIEISQQYCFIHVG